VKVKLDLAALAGKTPWAGALAALVGGLLPYHVASWIKERSMLTPMEKACNALIVILAQRVGDMNDQIDKLKIELAERPSKSQLDEMRFQRDAARGDVDMLRAEVRGLQEHIEQLKSSKKGRVKRVLRKLRDDRSTAES